MLLCLCQQDEVPIVLLPACQPKPDDVNAGGIWFKYLMVHTFLQDLGVTFVPAGRGADGAAAGVPAKA